MALLYNCTTWGFVESGSNKNKKVFNIEGELYDHMVFVLI